MSLPPPPPRLMPRIEEGNVWDYHAEGHWVVIPTNLQRNETGKAVMGLGLAHDALSRWWYLNEWYATSILSHIPEREWPDLDMCSAKFLAEVGFCPNYKERLLFLPTKRKWRQEADVELIREGLRLLSLGLRAVKDDDRTMCIPPLGCGYGKLPYQTFLDLIREANLPPHRVLIVKPKGFGE